ncbi:MAG: FTR1 family protein [Gammaproteobacteria bacterium]|nr:FTR1 family protein [Gammaproteobacteria bacterium]
MLAALIIVFREVLEASLIVGIVLAATKTLTRRHLWIAGGIAVGVVGAVVVAIFADLISTAVSGMGQEIFNTSILFIAVVMLGWHNVWMTRHGREIAKHLNNVGAAVTAGSRSMYVLALVVALAVLREGAEVVLFLYGIAVTQAGQYVEMFTGGVLGLAVGIAFGYMVYRGLLRISSRYLFKITGWLIALLAAGMAAQGAAFLVQADVLPVLIEQVWDSSKILSQSSLFGRMLQALIGYADRPSGIQVLFYVVTLLIIVGLSAGVRNLPTGVEIKRWLSRESE